MHIILDKEEWLQIPDVVRWKKEIREYVEFNTGITTILFTFKAK